MTLPWWLAWTPVIAGIAVLWALMAHAKRQDARQTAERDADRAARMEALRDLLEERRQATGWYQSQAYFDAELECIEIAEEARSRRNHPSARPHPHT